MICFLPAKPVPIVLIHGVTSTVDAVEEQKSPREIWINLMPKPKQFLNFKNQDKVSAPKELM
jgi:hypothetical protein